MAATELFAMDNPRSTCTAASLTWCHMMLSGTTTPRAEHFLPDDPTLNRNMHAVGVGATDHDPATQVALMGLEIVDQGAGAITSQQIADKFSSNAPHVGLFWNSFHTMAYRYHHHDKRYFDNNVGLYKAKYTKHIVAKMEEVRKRDYLEGWCGYAIIKISSHRFRLPMG